MKKYRSYAMIISVFGLALLLVGVTYSFFNYTKTGGANNLGTGNISFNATYGTAINLTNVFPMTSSEASEANLASTTVSITGSTNYSDGEEFLVSIVDVNNTVNNKKIPINYIATYEANNGSIGTSTDNYFEATKNANIYKLNSTGRIVEDKQVLVGFIKGGTDGINGTLTISAYVDADRIAITDTPTENSDWINGRTVFSTTEWSSFQGNNAISFKLRTESNQGIWVEEPDPDNVTPDSCFTYRLENVYTLNTNMTQTELNDCIDYVNNSNAQLLAGVTAEEYCLGTGHNYTGDFQSNLYLGERLGNPPDVKYLSAHNIISEERGINIYYYNSSCGTDIVFPSKMNYTLLLYNENMTSQEINTCTDYITNNAQWLVNTNGGETVSAFCAGTGTAWGRTFQEMIDDNRFSYSHIKYLKNHNIIIDGETKKFPVLVAGDGGPLIYDGGYVTSVTFNNNLKIIESALFKYILSNDVENITIPNSVKFIGQEAFLFDSVEGQTNRTFNILGTPYIDTLAIDAAFTTVTYGGTCDLLYNRSISYKSSNNKSYIMNSIYSGPYDVITTDNNYCKVYGSYLD